MAPCARPSWTPAWRPRAGGPGVLGLRELAKSLGVSPTAAYRHFPSLDHLVAAVSQRAREQLGGEMLAALADAGVVGDAEAVAGPVAPDAASAASAAWLRLRAVGRAYVAFALREPGLFEIAFTPCVGPDHPDNPSAWSILRGVFDDLHAAGAIDDRRHAEGPLIAWSAVHGLSTILVRQIQPHPVDEAQAIESIVDAVARALR